MTTRSPRASCDSEAFRAWLEKNGASESELVVRPKALPAPLLRRLRADPDAWRFYRAQPPWYQRTSAFWVTSAKRPETRERRFEVLLACSKVGRRIGPLNREGPILSSRIG